MILIVVSWQLNRNKNQTTYSQRCSRKLKRTYTHAHTHREAFKRSQMFFFDPFPVRSKITDRCRHGQIDTWAKLVLRADRLFSAISALCKTNNRVRRMRRRTKKGRYIFIRNGPCMLFLSLVYFRSRIYKY